MPTLTHKGHTFNTNTEAAALLAKKDLKALDKHLANVVEKGKQIMTAGDKLETRCTAPGGAWVIGQTVEDHQEKRRQHFKAQMEFQRGEDAVFAMLYPCPVVDLPKETIKRELAALGVTDDLVAIGDDIHSAMFPKLTSGLQ